MKRLTMGILFLLVTFALSTSAWAKSDIHTVTSESAYLILDGTTGEYHTGSNVDGECTISWKENTRCSFLDAKLRTSKDKFEFIMVSISNCDNDKIEGLFDIYKNGILAANGVVGKAWGLSGLIIQFTAGTSQCNQNEWEFWFNVDYRFAF
jgi:hypothetical protein